jgi:phosphate transport system substrate-binding protein
VNWSKLILPLLTSVCVITACSDDANKPTDTLGKGKLTISVDETYRPIVEEQSKVFDSSYPEAYVTVNYKPETECLKDFMGGNTRLIMVTRELTADEKLVLEQKKIVPTTIALAKDAIAVVLNNESADTVLSIAALKGILTGVYKTKYTVVFDNQGSSTVRYMLDSLIPGERLGANVFAAKSNEEVIEYVAKNPDAIGFTGVSYVSDFSDPDGLAFIKTVKIAALYNDSLNEAYKPYQAYIAQKLYPLTRNLYYIKSETYPGLATGFGNFLANERGQLIFKQARLFPLRSNIVIREASVNP